MPSQVLFDRAIQKPEVHTNPFGLTQDGEPVPVDQYIYTGAKSASKKDEFRKKSAPRSKSASVSFDPAAKAADFLAWRNKRTLSSSPK